MIRPLFIIGNKRSGTSQLVRVLNLHPQVFVSHESDILWALFQYVRGQPFQAHPWDSGVGLRHTLETCGGLFQRDQNPRAIFAAVQQRLLEIGTPFLPPQKKSGVLWIGDKKPFQHTDPQLLEFIHGQFPDAHFLHIVRHPFDVVTSSERFNATRNGDFWRGLTREAKIERWAFHEQQVLALRESRPSRVHSLRYEDFCRNTEEEMARVFGFLELPRDARVLKEAARTTRPVAREAPVIGYSPETARIAEVYGYDLKTPTSRLQAASRNIIQRLSRQFAH